ncbi:hypothetical protein [Psychroflexus sp. ALD_RP9]|uniref:hypothetical protein n=1 Tax=Psychroflexus sp. ALD_RP9 TaxID=2777186 RepID=UPI001A8D10B7|nr:hypothetical protein [Psychroflexus sp. ALD_RP9]QSS96580.1 LysM domain-containing protein [Psychroflexus sp. ALD_RP9]
MNEVKVISGQSVFDIAIQVYGTIEGLSLLCLENNISITEELVPGQLLQVPEFEKAKKEIVNYFENRNIKPATALTQAQKAITVTQDDNCNYCKYFK